MGHRISTCFRIGALRKIVLPFEAEHVEREATFHTRV